MARTIYARSQNHPRRMIKYETQDIGHLQSNAITRKLIIAYEYMIRHKWKKTTHSTHSHGWRTELRLGKRAQSFTNQIWTKLSHPSTILGRLFDITYSLNYNSMKGVREKFDCWFNLKRIWNSLCLAMIAMRTAD